MFHLDTQAFSASGGHVDGGELAALDLVQHGLAGDAEHFGGMFQGQPAVGDVRLVRSRSAWLTRIRQGAPGVSCSPVMNPSRSHR